MKAHLQRCVDTWVKPDKTHHALCKICTYFPNTIYLLKLNLLQNPSNFTKMYYDLIAMMRGNCESRDLHPARTVQPEKKLTIGLSISELPSVIKVVQPFWVTLSEKIWSNLTFGCTLNIWKIFVNP